MGIISGYAWILPAVIAVGWIVAWWGMRWIRWGVLGTGVIVSVLVFVAGVHVSSPPLPPHSGCTRQQVQCMDGRPIPWLEAGVFGVACCVLLLCVTLVAEVVLLLANRSRR